MDIVDHGAGRLTYIETPDLWPSFVGKLEVNMTQNHGSHMGVW